MLNVSDSPPPSNEIDPFENPAGRDPGEEFWEWDTIFDQLENPVLDNLPFLHPVRGQFFACDTVNDIHPSLDAIKNAIAMFGNLPPEVRRKAMNGWEVPLHLLKPGKIEDHGESNKLCLYLTAGKTYAQDKLGGDIRRVASGTNEPVEILVHVGARKLEVVNALRSAADRLERQWETVITQAGIAAAADCERSVRRAAARGPAVDSPATTVKEPCPTCGGIAVDSSFDEEQGLTMRCTSCGREWLPGEQFCTSTDAAADAGDWTDRFQEYVDAEIDGFYESTSTLLKSLGISTSEDDDGITMFDGSKRRVFYADGERGIAGGFLGPKFDTVKGGESNEE